MAFLVFEGLDGSGKSSLMKQLESYLDSKKISFIQTREPGGTPLGEQLRLLILTKNEEVVLNPTPRSELLMYEASRAQHVEQVIRPALIKKQWVLCDRFTASSVAFQSGGRQIKEDDVDWLNQFAVAGVIPDLQILLDLSVEESKKRRQSRQGLSGEKEDRIESEADIFHNRVREGFLKQTRQQPEKWLVLDAANSPEDLFNQLLNYLKEKKWLDS